jgi:hypothetical protein
MFALFFSHYQTTLLQTGSREKDFNFGFRDTAIVTEYQFKSKKRINKSINKKQKSS